MYLNDSRIVMTLDAGGTNFEFSAIQGNSVITESYILPASPNDLDKTLSTLVNGFNTIKAKLPSEPVAISFAFPGPADYLNGVIGDLPNFPAFRNGIALGPYLREKFRLPVFINNDGNLFAYGEALAGVLPDINESVKKSGNPKEYRNLFGITIGTGFGAGVVIDKILLTGDNGCGGDVWCSANKFDSRLIAEEGVSIRGLKRFFAEFSGLKADISPQEIFEIAEGDMPGDRDSAIKAFDKLGRSAGYTIAEFLNIIDGIVVIGGGISKAHKYIFPAIVNEMRERRSMISGNQFPRLQMEVYDLTTSEGKNSFLKNESSQVKVPGSDTFVKYNPIRKTGITVSTLGTGKAVALGAYAFALRELDKMEDKL